jgi:conjugal transfer mating pair stabilization protein TraG
VKYVDDCVEFELMRPGTTLTFNTLFDPGCGGATAFLDTIGLAANPANYTVSYLEGQTQGTSVSCQQAFTDIQTYYTNAANTNQAVQSACGSNNVADAGQCQSILGAMISGSLGITMDPGTFIAMNSIAAYTNQTLLAGGTTFASGSLTMTNQAQSGTAGGFTTGIMNPLMIDSFVAYTFMVFPIIALFVVTPLWRQAITLIISMLVWNTLLRSLDVVTFHMWVTQYQKELANALNNAGMGIAANMGLPMKATKYLGQFAQMRTYVFMLATFISGALFKVSDSTLSRMASDAKMQNALAEKALEDPNERGKEVMQNSAASARTMAMTQALKDGVYGATNTIGQGMVANEFANAAGGMGKLDAAGGGMGEMMEQQRNMSAVDTAKSAGYAGSISPEQASKAGALNAMRDMGAADNQSTRQAYENAATQTMQQNAQGASAREQAQRLQQNLGLKSETDAYKVLADFNNASGEASAKAFGGDREGYTTFLQGTAELSQGDRVGVLAGAQAAGVNLHDYAATKSYTENMQKSGMIQPVMKGQAIEQAIQQVEQQAEQPRNVQAVNGELQKNLAAGNFEAIKGDQAQMAAMAALTSKDVSQITKDDMVPAHEGMRGAVFSQDLQEMGRTGILSDAGRMDTWKHIQKGTGMDAREATSFMGSHSNIDSIEKYKDFERASGLLGHSIATGDYKALADSYAQKDGSQERILTAVEANALNNQMHKSGNKNFHARAGEVARFGYDASTNSITMAHTTGGGKSEFYNLDTKRSGHDFEKIDRDVTTVDKGLRENAGSFIKTGYDNQNFNQTAKHGAYMMQIGGKEMEVKGDLYYGKDGKLIGGTVENGINQSVLAYQMDKEGHLHYAQVSGKADTHGNLVAGKATEITEQEFVRNNEHGAAVINSRGTAGLHDVDVKGSGGVKLDQSNTHTFGTRVESKQNLAGSAAQGAGFGQDGNINPGEVATTVAIGQGALHETSSTIGDVSTVSKALLNPKTVYGGPTRAEEARIAREVERGETRASTEAARGQQARVQQAQQKTSRVLQNQSRTSQVPHGKTSPRPGGSSVRPGIAKPGLRPGGGKPAPKP